jgi:hypothetical protein
MEIQVCDKRPYCRRKQVPDAWSWIKLCKRTSSVEFLQIEVAAGALTGAIARRFSLLYAEE